MGDEIDRCNEIRIECFGSSCWAASIGPDGLGLRAWALSAAEALRRLTDKVILRGWIFDDGWRPRVPPPAAPLPVIPEPDIRFIRVVNSGLHYQAHIGRHGAELSAVGLYPDGAVRRVMDLAVRDQWVYQDGWKPKA